MKRSGIAGIIAGAIALFAAVLWWHGTQRQQADAAAWQGDYATIRSCAIATAPRLRTIIPAAMDSELTLVVVPADSITAHGGRSTQRELYENGQHRVLLTEDGSTLRDITTHGMGHELADRYEELRYYPDTDSAVRRKHGLPPATIEERDSILAQPLLRNDHASPFFATCVKYGLEPAG